ncbi:hypothetical protein BN1044_00483 [Hafnia alvei]|uniref:Uncharacterized protein n=1 Tax=Hafnia alvei TaxID=569 RepID=A0A1C6YVX0_HAFAL|nr:hypothetical protein BN1044_00483 [Hafnia alvei]
MPNQNKSDSKRQDRYLVAGTTVVMLALYIIILASNLM